ncbi:hypothetical protein AJ80_04853 [Polytolypa hystricis UAMH7299]|uniref:Uncharacterized protein n=1 Tax=Polytolypa hystricis (strain UAMH7299) TaxID=1447883 RepID=A0A2B7Y9X4_POLH7|nr:hypothetical protein AJ80_04853 [Polytolypa hystricis UAMH7299]
MCNLVVPLGYSLIVASFMLNQISLATAACTNKTSWIQQSIEAYHSDTSSSVNKVENHEIKTQLDFISCPSSGNVSCTLPPKTYTVTVTPRFTISNNASVDDSDWESVRDATRASHVLDLPVNSSDSKAIIAYAQEVWRPRESFRLLDSPLTLSLTTKNISHYANLTVDPGYNMTLTYITLVASTWVRFAQCENKSMDGALIGAIMPYYVFPPTRIGDREPTRELRIAGEFIVDKKFLNDSVPDTKDGSGIGLKAGNGWATAYIVLGVLAFSWL